MTAPADTDVSAAPAASAPGAAAPPRDQAHGLRTLPRPAAVRAPWVAVAGAKGGVGKTTLAVNLALLLARAGRRPLLADLDPGCGDVDVHLRAAPRFTLEDLAAGDCGPGEALADGPGGIALLSGRSGSLRLAHDPAFGDAALSAVAAAAAAGRRCVVVADTGAGIGPLVLAAAARADLVLGVTAPDPASLTDAYALCKVLHARGAPLPRLVVNRVRSRDEAMRTAAKLAAVTKRFLGVACEPFAWVHDDRGLERAVCAQRPFALDGAGRAHDDLRSLCAAVLSALPLAARPSGQRRDSP